MALANRKSENIFNKNTGGSKNAKSITDSKELEIKAKFYNGDHILDEGMFENLAPALYAVQQVAEEIEELRRFIVSEINSISTSKANALTANCLLINLSCNILFIFKSIEFCLLSYLIFCSHTFQIWVPFLYLLDVSFQSSLSKYNKKDKTLLTLSGWIM